MTEIDLIKTDSNGVFTMESWQKAELTKQIRINSLYMLGIQDEIKTEPPSKFSLFDNIKKAFSLIRLKKHRSNEVYND